MGTKIFKRAVRAHEIKIRDAAIQAIADTMEETHRFGSFDRKHLENCAARRLKAQFENRPWKVKKCPEVK